MHCKFLIKLFYEDLEEKAHWLTESVNDKAVYRTAPATPGLLKSKENTMIQKLHTTDKKQQKIRNF